MATGEAAASVPAGASASTGETAASTPSSVQVRRVKIERFELTAEKVPELRELFGLDRLPLGESRVEIELAGVPTAVVNALRRVVTDEMTWHALQVPEDGFVTSGTTELFMLPQFVNDRIALLPLRPQIPSDVIEELQLQLDATNTSTGLLAVYAGDLEVTKGKMPEALFNPTFKLAVLQPGKRLVIRGIHISSGSGRVHARYQVARRAALRHLDLPQYSKAETHSPDGVAADQSGYKVSSLVANPRHHVLSATLPATTANPTEVRSIFADACANIKDRLRLVAAAVEQSVAEGSHGRGIQYTVVTLESGLAEASLLVPGETHTIGELVRRSVYETSPDVAYVEYSVISHTSQLSLQMRHSENVTAALLRALRHAIAIFDEIQRGVLTVR
jgi:DNA-directed RNA polymerase subunit L